MTFFPSQYLWLHHGTIDYGNSEVLTNFCMKTMIWGKNELAMKVKCTPCSSAAFVVILHFGSIIFQIVKNLCWVDIVRLPHNIYFSHYLSYFHERTHTIFYQLISYLKYTNAKNKRISWNSPLCVLRKLRSILANIQQHISKRFCPQIIVLKKDPDSMF